MKKEEEYISVITLKLSREFCNKITFFSPPKNETTMIIHGHWLSIEDKFGSSFCFESLLHLIQSKGSHTIY